MDKIEHMQAIAERWRKLIDDPLPSSDLHKMLCENSLEKLYKMNLGADSSPTIYWTNTHVEALAMYRQPRYNDDGRALSAVHSYLLGDFPWVATAERVCKALPTEDWLFLLNYAFMPLFPDVEEEKQTIYANLCAVGYDPFLVLNGVVIDLSWCSLFQAAKDVYNLEAELVDFGPLLEIAPFVSWFWPHKEHCFVVAR